jgi:hypothetical protein
LEEQLSPNLKIHFEPDHPDIFSDGLKQYRIQVFSRADSRKVELEVNELKLSGIAYSEIHLRPLEERNETGTKRVAITPKRGRTWDFITVFPDGTVVLNHIPRPQQLIFEIGSYKFELMASSPECPLRR